MMELRLTRSDVLTHSVTSLVKLLAQCTDEISNKTDAHSHLLAANIEDMAAVLKKRQEDQYLNMQIDLHATEDPSTSNPKVDNNNHLELFKEIHKKISGTPKANLLLAILQDLMLLDKVSTEAESRSAKWENLSKVIKYASALENEQLEKMVDSLAAEKPAETPSDQPTTSELPVAQLVEEPQHTVLDPATQSTSSVIQQTPQPPPHPAPQSTSTLSNEINSITTTNPTQYTALTQQATSLWDANGLPVNNPAVSSMGVSLAGQTLTVNSSIDQIQQQINMQQQQQQTDASQHIQAASILSQMEAGAEITQHQQLDAATAQQIEQQQHLEQQQQAQQQAQAQQMFGSNSTVVVYNNQAYHQITNEQTGETILQPLEQHELLAAQAPADPEVLPMHTEVPGQEVIGSISVKVESMKNGASTSATTNNNTTNNNSKPDMKSGKVLIDLVEHGANPEGRMSYTLNVKSKLPRKVSKIYECSLCQQICRNITKIKKHNMYKHYLPLTCFHCGEGYADKDELREHSAKHDVIKLHVCTLCKSEFKKASHLQAHLLKHKEGPGCNANMPAVNKFPCPVCTKTFRDEHKMHRHTMTHDGCADIHSCEVCKKSNVDVNLSCHICQRVFTRAYRLKAHMHVHDGIRHQCNICGKMFKQEYSLKVHKSEHAQDGKHECPVCQKRFPLKSLLKKHSVKHQEAKPFQCQVCGKAFPLAWRLKKHTLVHNPVKSFICSLCGKAFVTPDNLRQHVKTHNKDPNSTPKPRQRKPPTPKAVSLVQPRAVSLVQPDMSQQPQQPLAQAPQMIHVIHQDQLVAAEPQQITTSVAPAGGTTVTIPTSFVQQHPTVPGLMAVPGTQVYTLQDANRPLQEAQPQVRPAGNNPWDVTTTQFRPAFPGFPGFPGYQ